MRRLIIQYFLPWAITLNSIFWLAYFICLKCSYAKLSFAHCLFAWYRSADAVQPVFNSVLGILVGPSFDSRWSFSGTWNLMLRMQWSMFSRLCIFGGLINIWTKSSSSLCVCVCVYNLTLLTNLSLYYHVGGKIFCLF